MHSVRASLLASFICGLALASLPGGLRGQSMDEEWDPGRLLSTRADLQALLTRYEQVESSSGYSAGLKRQARAEAAQAAGRPAGG